MQSVSNQVCHLSGRIAVALSGGIDSMCLLDVLRKVSGNFEVLALNVEHGIRGENSKADSQFVKDYCQNIGIKCISVCVDAPAYAKQNKLSIELAARELRYQFFDKVIKEGKANYIALAHHQDDLCETVMMRIFRGTGLDGLIGIQSKGNYIRPLLGVTRAQIIEYVAKNKLPYREDESNADSDYSRNFIRNEIFPKIEERWSGYRKSFVKLSQIAKENEDYFDSISPRFTIQNDYVWLKIDELLSVHTVICKHAIRNAVTYLTGGVDFEEANLNNVLSLLSLQNGASIDLANGLKAYKEYDKLVFAFNKEYPYQEIPFTLGEFDFCGNCWEITERVDEKLRFDVSKIPSGAVIRNRKDGDTFTRFGGITTSLGDFYTDKKVPKRLRNLYPVIAIDNQILVTAFEIADSVKSGGGVTYTLKLK